MWFATSKGLDRFDGNRFKPHLYADMVQAEQRLSQVFIKLTPSFDNQFLLRLSQAVDNQKADTIFTFNPLNPSFKNAPLPQTPDRSDTFLKQRRKTEWKRSHPDSVRLHVEGLQPTRPFEAGRRFAAWNGGHEDWPLLYRSWHQNTHLLFLTEDSIGHMVSQRFTNSLPTQGDEHSCIVSADENGLVFFQLNKYPGHPKGRSFVSTGMEPQPAWEIGTIGSPFHVLISMTKFFFGKTHGMVTSGVSSETSWPLSVKRAHKNGPGKSVSTCNLLRSSIPWNSPTPTKCGLEAAKACP